MQPVDHRSDHHSHIGGDLSGVAYQEGDIVRTLDNLGCNVPGLYFAGTGSQDTYLATDIRDRMTGFVALDQEFIEDDFLVEIQPMEWHGFVRNDFTPCFLKDAGKGGEAVIVIAKVREPYMIAPMPAAPALVMCQSRRSR
jgi:hypothetical protein